MTPLLLIAFICGAGQTSQTVSSTDPRSTSRAAPLETGRGTQEISAYRLDNGLEVVLAPEPRRALAAVNIWYHVGADDEPEGQRGIAHLVEHLMFEGSANVPPGGHVRLLRELGVDVLNAHTGRHRTRYLTATLPPGLDTVFWLEAQRMGSLLDGLTEEAFERERAVVLRELRERVDLAPYGLARQKLWRELFPSDHPYHHRIEGVAADLEALRFEDVRRFIKRWYGPANATIVVSGGFDESKVRSQIARHFAGLEAKTHPERSTPKAPRTSCRETVSHTETIAGADAVLVGWKGPPSGSDEIVTAALTAELLSGGRGVGILHERLVREKGLARQIRVRVSEQAAHSVLSIIAVARAGVDPSDLLRELDAALAELADGGITDRMVESAARRMSTRRATALDGAGGLIEAAERVHRTRRGLSPAGCMPRETLDVDGLARFVGEWLAPERGAAVLARATPGDSKEQREEKR